MKRILFLILGLNILSFCIDLKGTTGSLFAQESQGSEEGDAFEDHDGDGIDDAWDEDCQCYLNFKPINGCQTCETNEGNEVEKGPAFFEGLWSDLVEWLNEPVSIWKDGKAPSDEEFDAAIQGTFIEEIINYYGTGEGKPSDQVLGILEEQHAQFLAAQLIFFAGKFKVNKNDFHRNIKPDILGSSGSFSSTVGNNPDINVKNGKIILTGNGQYKGKTFFTDLDASDFFESF